MDSVCVNCVQTFTRSKDQKRIERYSLNKAIPNLNVTVGEALQGVLEHAQSFTPVTKLNIGNKCICVPCYQLVVKMAKGRKMVVEASVEFNSRQQPESYLRSKLIVTPKANPESTSRKRKMSDRTPVMTPRSTKKVAQHLDQPEPKRQAGRKGFKALAVKHINNGNYGTCFRLLMTHSDKAQGMIIGALGKMIHAEVHQYKKNGTLSKRVLTLDCVETLSWPNMLEDAPEHMPIVTSVLSHLLVPAKKAFKLDLNPECIGEKVPVLGMLLSAAMFSRFPTQFKLFPGLVSTMLYKHGNHHAVSKII